MNRQLIKVFAAIAFIQLAIIEFGYNGPRPTTVLLLIALILCVGFLGIYNRQEDDAG